jgi:hypothetical protein
MTFVMPPRSQVGHLDPEIAGEGQKVILSDGDVVTWTPPPVKPVVPDYSQIKHLQKYFGRVGTQAWPAWVYHPTEPARLLKDAHEAAELGICFRETTAEEKAQFGGLKYRWAWKDDCLWRPQPYASNVVPFDPRHWAHVKNYVAQPANPAIAQNALLEALIPLVTSAVVTALHGARQNAPAHVDPVQWEKFLQFQAWQKSAQTVEALVEEAASPKTDKLPLAGNTLVTDNGAAIGNALASDERAAWEQRAHHKGIKVDGRWSLERLKAEVEKAA